MAPPQRPYTPVVRSGDWLIVSGQIGLDQGQLVEGGLEPELRQVFVNLRTVLASEGAALADVVRTTIYTVDSADAAKMNELYVEELGGHLPARSAVTVSALPRNARLMIDAMARVDTA